VVLFVPGVERDGVTTVDQPRWVDGALEMFGRIFRGATVYPKAQGIWRDESPSHRRRSIERLEEITSRVGKHARVNVEPVQLATLLLEKTARQLSEAEAEALVRPRRRASG